MATVDYRNHARARPLQAIIFRAFSKSEPALEGITRGHVVQRMLEERQQCFRRGMASLVASSARRLNQRKEGKDKWTYTRRHCVEVGFLCYLIASEAKKHDLPGAEGLDPELCYVGGILHDIGKTFLPLSLIVKELGVEFLSLKFLEGARMNDIERRVLRDEHISAGTRYVRMFGGNGDVKAILDMVGLHHVMYNGKNTVVPSYPTLFRGRDLPFHARVAKTADFLSAVLPRHYRPETWIHSFRTAAAYAMTVAERELDPLTVACFITGTHDLGPDGVMRAMERFKHPDGQKGISDYQRMKEYVRDGVEKAPEFEALAGRWDWKKVVRYEEMAEGHAVKYGFPRLIDVSPFLSIKNRVGNA